MEIFYPQPRFPEAGELVMLATGVHWLRMRLPFALDHINLWLLEDGEDVVLVDTGYADEANRQIWSRVLASRTVSRIVVTHHHPDHLGLASWLQSRSGAPVLMSQGEYAHAHLTHAQAGRYGVPAMIRFFAAHGLDWERLGAMASLGNTYNLGVPELPGAYRRLMGGDVVVIGGNEWRVISGYGHSPEHLSLHCAALGVLISGDMLLPRITTNIGVSAEAPDEDPLGRFLDSIGRYASLPEDTLVLPSHGLPFVGIQARLLQLSAHHTSRCQALIDACKRQPQTAADLIPVLFSRSVSDPHQLMFAMGETIGHLNHLVGSGALSRFEENGVFRYQSPTRQKRIAMGTFLDSCAEESVF